MKGVAEPFPSFLETKVPKTMILLNAITAIVYFIAIAFFLERGSLVLFSLLIAGEVFHVWQALTFLHTIWETDYMPPGNPRFQPPVDVFITTPGEPVEVVQETALAAKSLDYPDFKVYILNDGYVRKKNNWRDIADLAKKLEIGCFTRRHPGGFKAGNINHATRLTTAPLIVIFDADHVPHRDFLKKTIPYFINPQLGFVQSPQFYRNQDENFVTTGAWEQQALFFGPICKGRNRFHSVTMCGTNMVIRRQALEEVGGINETSIAEDFITGLLIHEKGWKSTYVPEVLAEGLAPEDFLTYSKQQFRWARGSMDLIFRYNPLFRRGTTWQQKLQYLSSVSFFLSGAVVLMNAAIPLVFFFTGLTPFNISTMTIALVFLPYILLTLYILGRASNFSFTFRSLAFAMAGFDIHLKALLASALGTRDSFAISSKQKINGNFLNLVIPHIAYIIIAAIGLGFSILREGVTPSVVTNAAWAFINVAIFAQFIVAAWPAREKPAEAPRQLLSPRIAIQALNLE